MATLKLLTTPDQADGSHRIGSPGGYEFWHFYAEDSSQNVRVAVGFHDGFGLNPDYIKRYAAYRRKPTRNTPPTPSQYPCLQVSVFEKEKALGSWTTYFPSGSFHADDGESLTLGSNRAIFRQDEIALALSEPQLAMSVDLTFRSGPPITLPLPEQSFPPSKSDGAEHQWIPARPLCTVHGVVRRGGRSTPLTGLGQHNHYYGTGPVFAVAKRWIRGCVLFPRVAEIFQSAGEWAIVITADDTGVRNIEKPPFTGEWKKRVFGPSYPLTMNFGKRLILRNPRIARAIDKQMQLAYDAYVDGEQATAWVEIDVG
jgi:hypothetical protein